MLLSELRSALQLLVLPLPFLFFSFFCQLFPRLWNCNSVFLILKISQYGGSKWWVQLCTSYSCKNRYRNWHLHFHQTYDYRIWQAGTSRGVDSNETNQAASGDVTMSRSRNKLKSYLYYHSAYDHQTWHDDYYPQAVSTYVTLAFGHMVLQDHVSN